MRSKRVVVEARNLTVRFGMFTAVDRVSFSVKQGEIFGFLGANGAGKTTTIRVLCGLLVPSAGDASVAGLSCTTATEQVKNKIGYMSQRFTLYNDLSVAENLEFTAALRKMPARQLSERTRELFEFIEFNYPPTVMVQDLPGGIKQQLALVAAMLHDPEVIFLDEPTAGVAPSVRARFWELIGQLATQGKTIFVTTHYMDEAEQCHRIALMRDGKIIAMDSPQQLKKSTFPEPLLEIDLPVGASREKLESMALDPKVARITPYGRRYHVLVLKPGAWNTLARTFPKSYRIRKIRPTLEDVFIRQVEGERCAPHGAEKSKIKNRK